MITTGHYVDDMTRDEKRAIVADYAANDLSMAACAANHGISKDSLRRLIKRDPYGSRIFQTLVDRNGGQSAFRKRKSVGKKGRFSAEDKKRIALEYINSNVRSGILRVNNISHSTIRNWIREFYPDRYGEAFDQTKNFRENTNRYSMEDKIRFIDHMAASPYSVREDAEDLGISYGFAKYLIYTDYSVMDYVRAVWPTSEKFPYTNRKYDPKVIEDAMDMYAEGKTVRSISEKLGPCVTTVHKWIDKHYDPDNYNPRTCQRFTPEEYYEIAREYKKCGNDAEKTETNLRLTVGSVKKVLKIKD